MVAGVLGSVAELGGVVRGIGCIAGSVARGGWTSTEWVSIGGCETGRGGPAGRVNSMGERSLETDGDS